jgi:aspartate-semialdehyde dehydrogenase
MKKIPVGILGATGMVGQNYIALLNSHPWFKVRYVAASSRSAGKKYSEAVANRWHQAEKYAPHVADLVVEDATDVKRAALAHKWGKCSFVFSALALGKEETRTLEEAYAAEGIPVISNDSANRWTPDVPVLIPEINPHHTDIIPAQRKNHGWEKGFIVVKPNC